MKDLKHLIYFENLLQEANNELVQQAKAEGEHALGYTCYFVPETLLNLPGCFSVRLRAPRTGSLDIATYYMSNYTCEYARALVERGMEGGYQFLDALAGVDACSMMNRAMEHFEILQMNDKPNFFVTHCDIPYKITDYTLDSYVKQMRRRVLDPLTEKYGVDTSDAAIRQAVKEHNEVCSIISEIGELRKEENPVITGYEYHVIVLVSQVCPHDLILPYLEETLAELKTRRPEAEFPFRARVVLAGSEIDDPEFTKLLESCGAMVVADRYCFGTFPGREEIKIHGGETAFDAVCRHYLHHNQCVRFMDGAKIDQRHSELRRLAEDYGADGIIYESMKFCEFWSYEKVLASHVLQQEMGIPCCTIEKEYTLGSVGQLRTRFQAFVESLEIKKLGHKEV